MQRCADLEVRKLNSPTEQAEKLVRLWTFGGDVVKSRTPTEGGPDEQETASPPPDALPIGRHGHEPASGFRMILA